MYYCQLSTSFYFTFISYKQYVVAFNLCMNTSNFYLSQLFYVPFLLSAGLNFYPPPIQILFYYSWLSYTLQYPLYILLDSSKSAPLICTLLLTCIRMCVHTHNHNTSTKSSSMGRIRLKDTFEWNDG